MVVLGVEVPSLAPSGATESLWRARRLGLCRFAYWDIVILTVFSCTVRGKCDGMIEMDIAHFEAFSMALYASWRCE